MLRTHYTSVDMFTFAVFYVLPHSASSSRGSSYLAHDSFQVLGIVVLKNLDHGTWAACGTVGAEVCATHHSCAVTCASGVGPQKAVAVWHVRVGVRGRKDRKFARRRRSTSGCWSRR